MPNLIKPDPGSGMAFESFAPKIDIPLRSAKGIDPGARPDPGSGFGPGEQFTQIGMPQDKSTVGKIWDLAKEWGPDIALASGSVMLGSALGLTGIGAVAAPGLIYTAAKTGQRLLAGKPQEPTLSEEITGQELPLKEITRPFIETAENILFFGGGAEAVRLAKGPVKGLLKGVQRVTQAQPLKPIGEAIWENVFVKPTNITVPYTGKTVREIFQPAIERLRVDQPKVERSFMTAKVQQALARDVLGNTIKEAKTLLPTEMTELMRGLTPGTSVTSGKVKDILYRADKGLSKVTKPQFKATLMDELGKSMMKPIEEVESAVTSSSLKRLFGVLEKPLVGKGSATEKEVRSLLTEVIHNPRFKPEIQQYAKDLYNFSAQAPLDVAKALTESSNEYLISKLMKNPGVVSSIMKPGYVSSNHPSIKGLFVAKDIELELDAMRRIPQIANQWSSKWFMGPWKTNKVILRPATHFRNIFGNIFANDVYGGMNAFDPRNWKIYMDAALDLKNIGPNTRDFKKLTGMTGRWGKEEMDQLVPALRYGANIFDKGLNLFDTVAAPARGIYAAEEAWAKVAKFIFNRKQGMKDIEAAYDAMRCTLNYSEITPFTAQVRAKAIPFFTWQSKIIPMTVEAAVKHPLRLGKWFALGYYLQNYALDQVGLSDGEWETIHKTMPEYMQKGMYLLMPWRDEKQQLKMLNMTWLIPGIGDISEVYQRGMQNPFSLAMQQPLLGLASTLLSKKKFSGAPLYYDWEEPATKFAKQAGAIWEMWSPAPMPGNIDWRTLQDAIQEKPEALSPEEAVASQFGFRLTSVNPTQMKRRSEALRRIHETEISTEMRKELKGTKNPEEISKVLDHYRQLRLEQRGP